MTALRRLKVNACFERMLNHHSTTNHGGLFETALKYIVGVFESRFLLKQDILSVNFSAHPYFII